MVSFVGALLVALLSSGSAIIAVFITNKATERRLEIQAKLEKEKEAYKTKLLKAEEIYSSLVKFKKTIFGVHLDWVGLAKNELTIQEVIHKANERENFDVTVLQARMGIHFPRLHARFEKSRELLKPANECYFAMTRGNELPEHEKRSFVNKILEAGSKFDEEVNKILIELSNQVNEM